MKKNKLFIGPLILLLLFAATIFVIFKDNELGALYKTLREANPIYLCSGLIIMFLFVASEGVCIKALLHSLGYKHGLLKCLKYSFLGFYYSSITPSSTGGQPAQIYYMKNDGISVGDSTISIMIISASYQIGMLMICLFFLVIKNAILKMNLGAVKYLAIFGAAAHIVLLSVFITSAFSISFLKKTVNLIMRVLGKLKIIKNTEKTEKGVVLHLEKYGQGALIILKRPKVLLLALVLIIFQILFRLSIAIVVYKSFGLHGYSISDILALQAFLALSVESLPLPGSVGAAEAGFYAVNSALFGSGNVITATLLTRGISFYSFLLVSGAVSLYAYISLKRRKAASGD